MLGLRYAETLSGTYARIELPEQQRRLLLNIETRLRPPVTWKGRTIGQVRGSVEADGLVLSTAVLGEVRLAASYRGFEYAMSFSGNDQQSYRLQGVRPIETPFRLEGVFLDRSGSVLGKLSVRFDFRADFLEFLSSWRVVRSH
jgi:hypothetical protein